jgi:hypothetical protein
MEENRKFLQKFSVLGMFIFVPQLLLEYNFILAILCCTHLIIFTYTTYTTDGKIIKNEKK